MEFHTFRHVITSVPARTDAVADLHNACVSLFDECVKFSSRLPRSDHDYHTSYLRLPYDALLVRLYDDSGDAFCFCSTIGTGIFVAAYVITDQVHFRAFYLTEDGAVSLPKLAGGGFSGDRICERVAESLSWFLCTLNHPDQRIIENAPSRKLNDKRIRSGRFPLIGYKTLAVLKPNLVDESSHVGGTHASPRVHMRRGHFRRRFDKEFWISAAIVGDKSRGLLLKDYKLVSRDDNRTRH